MAESLRNAENSALTVLERWREYARETVDEILHWREYLAERIYHGGWPEVPEHHFALLTSLVCSWLTRQHPNIRLNSIQAVSAAIDWWDENHNADQIPDQRILESELRQSLIVVNSAIDAILLDSTDRSRKTPSDSRPKDVGRRLRNQKLGRELFSHGLSTHSSETDGPHYRAMLAYLRRFVGTPHERTVYDFYFDCSRPRERDLSLIDEAAAKDGLSREEYIARDVLRELQRYVRASAIHDPIEQPSPIDILSQAWESGFRLVAAELNKVFAEKSLDLQIDAPPPEPGMTFATARRRLLNLIAPLRAIEPDLLADDRLQPWSVGYVNDTNNRIVLLDADNEAASLLQSTTLLRTGREHWTLDHWREAIVDGVMENAAWWRERFERLSVKAMPTEQPIAPSITAAAYEHVTLADLSSVLGISTKTLNNIAVSQPLPEPIQPATGKAKGLFDYRKLREWIVANYPKRASLLPETYSDFKIALHTKVSTSGNTLP